ncbi:MAG: AmmeMemoRadiSam system radical SAM enzyme [Planctomycetes bacterium]|nr:AmmeMemoRadiSam system radical SAM enzyme [Planctomycetota bacterium]
MALRSPEAIRLRTLMHELTRPAELYEPLPDGRLLCYACGHECKIAEGKEGVCRVRFNDGGVLKAPHGYVGALACDPIAKKPFFHAFVGAEALSFGMLGCDLHCGYCQNWVTSQAMRDEAAVSNVYRITPEQIVDLAQQHHAPVIATTYNEPLITAEWAVEVLTPANEAGLCGAFVSNGNATPRVLQYIRPCVQLYKVDLKSFDDKHYRALGGQLDNVKRTIRQLHQMGFWLEIVTLLIPGFNDSPDEVKRIADFLAGISRDIPWHITAFHSDYKMSTTPNTQVDQLIEACRIGRRAGLRYVYAGNRPGQVGEWEHTRCPACSAMLIERRGFSIRANRLRDGHCPDCRTPIPGFWSRDCIVPQENMGGMSR